MWSTMHGCDAKLMLPLSFWTLCLLLLLLKMGHNIGSNSPMNGAPLPPSPFSMVLHLEHNCRPHCLYEYKPTNVGLVVGDNTCVLWLNISRSLYVTAYVPGFGAQFWNEDYVAPCIASPHSISFWVVSPKWVIGENWPLVIHEPVDVGI